MIRFKDILSRVMCKPEHRNAEQDRIRGGRSSKNFLWTTLEERVFPSMSRAEGDEVKIEMLGRLI